MSMMLSYELGGLRISADFPIGPLVAARPLDVPVDVTLRLGRLGQRSPRNSPLRCEPVSETEALLIWGDVATVLVRDGNEMIVDVAPEFEVSVAHPLVLGPALGVLFHQRGLFTLHGSVVAIHGCAVAFVGWKGAGKSATAAALNARGHSLLSDDLLVVDLIAEGVPIALPTFPQMKLWPDTISSLGESPDVLTRVHPQYGKRLRPATECFQADPLPLVRIYSLATGDALRPEVLGPQGSLVEILQHSYAARFIGSAASTRQHLSNCQQLLQHVPVYRLERPRSFEDLPAVCEWMEGEVASCARHGAGTTRHDRPSSADCGVVAAC